MIAVGTPPRIEDGHADLSFVFKAVEEVARNIQKYTVVVTKSTVPVGTSRKIRKIIQQTRPDLKVGVDFDVASNPEFLREGSAISDFMRPDRVVVGADSKRAQEVLQKLYRPLHLIETPILVTGIESAELIKYSANAFLALKIGFINQISDLCEKTGANIQDVAKGMGLDSRIGNKFLNVGPGYGGSCFPKDTLALVKTARDENTPITIVEAVVKANDDRKMAMTHRVISKLSEKSGKKIAILGVTFKPNTDDMRDATSLIMIPELVRLGFDVTVYDPLYFKGSGREASFAEFHGVTWCENAYAAVDGVDVAVILTEWNEFRGLDFDKLSLLIKGPQRTLMDFRNIYKPHDTPGIDYICLGRGDVLNNTIEDN
jgi:UDPglucose 6-dehydrogenase